MAGAGEGLIKRNLPHSLLGRALLILVVPLVLLQVVLGLVFYEGHWDKVSRRLAVALAGDIGTVTEFLRLSADAETRARVLHLADQRMELAVTELPGEILPNRPHRGGYGALDTMLIEALDERLRKPFLIDTESFERDVVVLVQLSDGVLRFQTTRKRLFSTTTYVFVMWMVGTSLILLGIATVFLRNQVRPIRRLAVAADRFGKGRDAPSFKPEGAAEVRQAAAAFLDMRARIGRHVDERTRMLAGVSHDLRTPLTRMKLQLAMLPPSADVEALKTDVEEMQCMLEGYLAFVRGEGGETPRSTDLAALLGEVVAQARRKREAVDLSVPAELVLAVKPDALRRALTNLVENACRYGRRVAVAASRAGDAVTVTIDDDGPGIPDERREEAFRPFVRLEESRNVDTGGVGLGLAIARDIVHGHGGEIFLEDGPLGGLRVRLVLPV